MATNDIPFTIADRTFRSRLIVGTGKYSSHAVMAQAHEASGADMVTVAVRRVNLSDRTRESLLDYIDTNRYCRTRPAVPARTKPSGRRGSAARQVCRTG